MPSEEFNIEEVMQSRRHALEESLETVDAGSLKAISEELFPYPDHPGLEAFLKIIGESASGPFYHAMVDDHVHILYAHGKETGMWFIRGFATGPLEPGQVKIVKKIVDKAMISPRIEF